VRQLFDGGKDSPPLTRNMPPVSGAVRWSRGLLVRLRRTWVRLQGLTTELDALDQGRRAAAAMTGALTVCPCTAARGREAGRQGGVATHHPCLDLRQP
jgi:hypothetical protein